MRITSKGQVTIPQEIRRKAGLMPGTDVEFDIVDGHVRLAKASARKGKKTRGQLLIERLQAAGRARRAGVWDAGMSTDEIIRAMRGPPADEEIAALKRKKRA